MNIYIFLRLSEGMTPSTFTLILTLYFPSRWVELQEGLGTRKKELDEAIRLQKFYVETTETKVSFVV